MIIVFEEKKLICNYKVVSIVASALTVESRRCLSSHRVVFPSSEWMAETTAQQYL